MSQPRLGRSNPFLGPILSPELIQSAVVASEGNRIGPDLTHVGSRLGADYLDAFLQAPEAVIPGTAMKNFELWDEERAALVAFLLARR